MSTRAHAVDREIWLGDSASILANSNG